MEIFTKNALSFDGTGSITISDSTAIRVSNGFTIVTQFKPTSTSTQTIFEKTNEYKLEIDANGKLAFSVYDGTDYVPNVVGPSVVANTWYRLVITVNVGAAIEKTMYIDSSTSYSETTQTGTVTGTTNNLVIANGFSGVFDYFMMYGVVFGASDISSVYSNEFIPYNLNAFFSIEEGSGTTTNDVVTDNYSGSITNGTWVKGRSLEEVYNANSQVVIVRKYM